jgi:hypothetical protein
VATSRDWYAALLPFFPQEQQFVTASRQPVSPLREFYTQIKSYIYRPLLYIYIPYIYIKEWIISSSFAPLAHEQCASSAFDNVPAIQSKAGRGDVLAERSSEEKISELFAGKDLTKQHGLCAQLYITLSLRCFWLLYWRHFLRLLASGDAERIVAVLDYWFDHSYECLNTARFMPQEFFLGVHSALEALAGASWFRETARVVEERISQDGADAHPWRSIMAHSFGW